MRVFIGTFLDNDLTGCIPFDNIQENFAADLKPIKVENIHMTWLFIGNIVEDKVSDIQGVIEKSLSSFNDLIFTSKTLELWPPKKSPRLIVLAGELNRKFLLDDLNKDLLLYCSPDFKKDFLPHITVARFKKDRTVSKQSELPVIKHFKWKIAEVSLIESELNSEGTVYKKLKNWRLS